MFNKEVLDVLFTSHSDPQNENKYRVIREAGRQLAEVIMNNAPSSADASSAIRHVRNAVMEANAAIACEKALLEVEMRHEPESPTPPATFETPSSEATTQGE